MDEKKKPELTATMKALKLTRRPLGETLRLLKEEQECLQTALKKISQLSASAEFRIGELQRHGSGSLAYSSLQAGLQYYNNPGLGYVAYLPLGDSPNSVLVLSDPICHREKLRELIEAFLKVRNDPVFLHISKPVAQVLAEFGYSVNELGMETIIEIQDFDLIGGKKQQLRAARNRAQKDGIKVRELFSSDDSFLQAFKKISDDWLSQKVSSDNQMKLIVRPMTYVDEIDVRRFIAIKDDELIAYVVFDPMYEDGSVKGYIANQLRSNYDKGYSVVDFIILEAMETFKKEGKTELSLGFSPMYKVDDGEEFKHSKLLKAHFKYAFEKANYLYNFKNLARHKSLYRPEQKGAREEKVYCAMKTRFFLNRILNVYKALGLNPVEKVCQHLKDVLSQKFRACFCHTRAELGQAKTDSHDCQSESDCPGKHN